MTFTSSPKTPILLLKTKSYPHDTYEDFFSAHNYNPAFIPVLDHQFNNTNLQTVKDLFESGKLNPGPGRRYGGVIFTSQRAVEGFARVVGEVGAPKATEASHSLILYTVGPATSRSLSTVRDTHLPHATILGEDAGNGDNLSRFILHHYNTTHRTATRGEEGQGNKLPLLFLVGEQRSDIIPKTLMDEDESRLPAMERIVVDERVVYGTCVKESFEGDFGVAVGDGYRYLQGGGEGEERVMWVVVFSPTGCDAMLRVLKLGSQNGNEVSLPGKGNERRVFVATIGPTTRDHLRFKYGFEPDVCADKPSQDGVGDGIEKFMDEWRKTRSQ